MFGRLHLRHQVVVCIVAVQLGTLAVGAATLVLNARDAVEVEVSAGERSARALVLAAIGSALRDGPADMVLPRLAEAMVEPRHVDLALLDARAGALPVREAESEDVAAPAPDWFRRLVTPRLRETRIPVQANGTTYGYVSMTTAPRDEIAEVWRDVSGLIWTVALTALLSILALTLLVNRALRPLAGLRAAMRRLREGDLTARTGARPVGADLAPILAGFDALSESLERAEADRAALHRRIVELGDAERRAIAMELHDEFGPCLFGLKVKASAIARDARNAGAEGIAADAEAMLAIVAQIQASNARLLTTLRPMAIGQLPLADALRDLFEAFRTTHPGVDWRTDIPEALPETPEVVDLTVYRFFQEGATNALRHGHPQTVRAELSADAAGLRVALEDDGVGIAAGAGEGRGLSAMRDRIGAVGGRLVIGRTEAGGTRLSARVPLDAASDAAGALEAAS